MGEARPFSLQHFFKTPFIVVHGSTRVDKFPPPMLSQLSIVRSSPNIDELAISFSLHTPGNPFLKPICPVEEGGTCSLEA